MGVKILGNQSGKTSALSDLSLLLARWKVPVSTLTPYTTVPAMPFPQGSVAPFLLSWWGSQWMGGPWILIL